MPYEISDKEIRKNPDIFEEVLLNNPTAIK
jgi:hypothetical protein